MLSAAGAIPCSQIASGNDREIFGLKRLIRRRRTKEFLAVAGTWTRDHRLALLFLTDDSAQQARQLYNLKGCELYYLVGHDPSGMDFTLALERF